MSPYFGEGEVSSEEESSFIHRAYGFLRKAVVGLRTVGACLMLAVAGLADQFDLVDIISWIQSIFGYGAKIGDLLIVLAVGFFTLRKVTKGPMKFTQPKPGIDEGE